MTHATLLSDQSSRARVLARISPRAKVLGSELTLYDDDGGGFLTASYRIAWTKGPVRSVFVEAEELTEDETEAQISSATDTFLFYWHDQVNNYLYVTVRKADFTASTFLSVEFDLFAATEPTRWYSEVLDDTTNEVEWAPIISQSPSSRKSVADQLLGFSPIQGTNLQLINIDQIFNPLLGEVSFYNAKIKCWHHLGDEMNIANAVVFIDSTCGDVRTDYNKFDITINSDDGIFDKEIRANRTFSGNYSDFYNTTEWPDLDPNFLGRPKRIGFGYNEKVRMVNLNFQPDSNTEADNNTHGMAFSSRSSSVFGISNAGLIQFQSIINYATSTTTKIYFLAGYTQYLNNFQQNDHILLKAGAMNYTSGSYGGDIRRVINNPVTDGYVEISAVFTLNSLTTRAARCSIPRVYVEKDGVIYKPRCLRDYYTDIIMHSEVILFIAGYVATLGMGTAVTSAEAVYGDYYGNEPDNIGPFTDGRYNTNYHPAAFLWELMNDYLDIPSTELNQTAFAAVINDDTADRISFMAPSEANQDYPTFKKMISDILISGKMRLFKDNDNLWKVEKIDAPTDNAVSISEDEGISIDSRYSYQDLISEINVNFNKKERGDNPGESSAVSETVISDSSQVQVFYGVKKQRSFDSLHIDETKAQELCDFLLTVFGRRRGQHSISLPREYFNLLINEQVTLNMERLAGTTFDTTQKTLEGVIVEISRGLDRVQITLDDQIDFSTLDV